MKLRLTAISVQIFVHFLTNAADESSLAYHLACSSTPNLTSSSAALNASVLPSSGTSSQFLVPPSVLSPPPSFYANRLPNASSLPDFTREDIIQPSTNPPQKLSSLLDVGISHREPEAPNHAALFPRYTFVPLSPIPHTRSCSDLFFYTSLCHHKGSKDSGVCLSNIGSNCSAVHTCHNTICPAFGPEKTLSSLKTCKRVHFEKNVVMCGVCECQSTTKCDLSLLECLRQYSEKWDLSRQKKESPLHRGWKSVDELSSMCRQENNMTREEFLALAKYTALPPSPSQGERCTRSQPSRVRFALDEPSMNLDLPTKNQSNEVSGYDFLSPLPLPKPHVGEPSKFGPSTIGSYVRGCSGASSSQGCCSSSWYSNSRHSSECLPLLPPKPLPVKHSKDCIGNGSS